MSETITVKVGGEDKDILMTFGLLNELARKIGDIDNTAEIALDADLREEVLTSLLAERDAKGKVKEAPNLFTLGISVDDVTDLLNWAGGHVTDFFLKSLENTKGMLEVREGRLKALMPTSDGGES